VLSRGGDPELSIVIPVRDEEWNLGSLHRELTEVLEPLGRSYEIIFIEDGSRDRTFERLRQIRAEDPVVRVFRFARNFGQSAAFAAGFAAARGGLVVTMDGDLQNDPGDIPRMLDLANRSDVVCGWRRRRRDDWLTRHVPSVVANRMINWLSGIRVHDQGCSLKVFRAGLVKGLQLRPGHHRYLASIAHAAGGRVTEVEVHHRARRRGHSKYGLSRTFGVVVDLVRLPLLLRSAARPKRPIEPIYEIEEALESADLIARYSAAQQRL
jgi:glycosyltransferase involved in cell wall biosynthesis